MHVICEHCSARLNIPDDRLPSAGRVAVNCPKCGNKVMIDTGDRSVESGPPGPRAEVPGEKPDPTTGALLDTFEEGKKLALIMGHGTSLTAALRSAAEKLGYQCLQVESSREAEEKLRYHHFDLLLLGDGFDGRRAAESPVLEYLNSQSMSVRRKMFVALVGGAFKTADQMTGYALSVNLVVNDRDMGKLPGILKPAISGNEMFYKIFTDTLAEIGRV